LHGGSLGTESALGALIADYGPYYPSGSFFRRSHRRSRFLA